MAGNYPDVPSWRIPWDRDGTELHWLNNDLTYNSQASQAEMQRINDEVLVDNQGGMGPWPNKMLFMFPRLMDLDAIFTSCNNGNINLQDDAAVSADTTNGADGTWTSLPSWAENLNATKFMMRNNIQSISALGIKALRLVNHNQPEYYVVHLYGEPSAAANTERLEIVQVGSEVRVPPAHFDYADKPQGTQTTKQFRVKNLHPTLTANDIIVSFDTLTDTSPSVDGQHVVSADQSTYVAQVNIGALAPGAVSGTIDLRQVLASDAALGLWWGRVSAVAGSWA